VYVTRDGAIVYALNYDPDGRGLRFLVLREEPSGRRAAAVRGDDPAVARVSYFVGRDEPKWTSDVPAFNAVDVGEVCRGIGLKLKAYGNNVEKLFIVAPGSDPDRIKMRLGGTTGLSVNDAGELEAETPLGKVSFTKPVAYQEAAGVRHYVEVSYRVEGGEYGFEVGRYDAGKTLFIDPLLASTLIGGDRDDIGTSVAVDGAGNVFVAGYTASGSTIENFPTTPGVYDGSHNGGSDVFVSKFDKDLTTLLASTFIGGAVDEVDPSLAIDDNGDVYVAGVTSSFNFPTTPGAYDRGWNGQNDVFVSKLDNDLATLSASTCLGRTGNDWGYSLVIDENGNVFVSGTTTSTNFPTTPGAYDGGYNGGSTSYAGDIFISKLSGDLSALLASTFIGGSGADGSDRCAAVALDGKGNVYLTGNTFSTDFPTTPGAYDETYNGGDMDSFVSKLDTALTTLHSSTFLGGSDVEMCYTVALDGGGNVYVASHNGSANFPTTTGAYREAYDGGYGATVSKLDGDLSTLVASTFLGGSSNDAPQSLSLDDSGDVYVAGFSGSSDFPTTPGALLESNSGAYDAFVSKFDSDLVTLLASTFLGGDADEWIRSMTLDADDNVLVAGWAFSSDFPTTSGAYDESYNGGETAWVGGDAFVSKLDGDLSADSTQVAVLLASFSVRAETDAVRIAWRIHGDAGAGEFRVAASRGSDSWEVPVAGRFEAYDRSRYLEAGGVVTYTLLHRESGGGWRILHVQEIEVRTPSPRTCLLSAYPNPFNQSTRASFTVGRPQRIRISVYDAAGRRVAVLTDQSYESGTYAVGWDGRMSSGRQVPSGVYLLRMNAYKMSESRKLLLLK
jgi:hypothetical protein